MYYRIAQRNLSSQKGRTILTAFGVAIGTASLLGIVAFAGGLKAAVIETLTSQSPLTQITVQPKTEGESFLKSLVPKPEDSLTVETISQLEEIPHVENVYPQLNYDNISSLRVNIWGQSFQTDTMIFGVPYEYLQEDLEDVQDWQSQEEPYPAIISRRIIDLYNLTVAPSNSLPNFSEADIIGLEFTLLPGQSTFFPQLSSDAPSIKARIAGFSDKVDMIGVTFPLELVRDLNQRQNPDGEERYLKLFVNIDAAENVEAVTNSIEGMGLYVKSTLMEIQIFEKNFRIITVGLSLISFIILFVAGLTIANTFLSSVNERREEIGIMRALGARRGDIQKIFLAEASILGLIGGVAGVILAWLGGFVVDAIALSAFPDVSSKPDTLLKYDGAIIIGVILFAVLLSTIFALIPSMRAARLKPLEALSE